jgi:multidrug efflux pump subunit AcrB
MFRADPQAIDRLHVRSGANAMVPLRTLLTRSTVLGSTVVNRYNQFSSASINGHGAPGRSTGEALLAMERTAAANLPQGYGFEWTGLAYQERQTGNQIFLVGGFALIFAYLFLVAQFESWTLPISVLLSVTVAVLGALVALVLARIENNIYAQIGLVLLIGLAAKNAILIIEFANTRRAEGTPLIEAAEQGIAQRFRPVLMTAFAFILGVVPLVVATGAGAGSRRSIGTTVFGGMLAATILGTLLIPALYVMVQSLRERVKKQERGSPSASPG